MSGLLTVPAFRVDGEDGDVSEYLILPPVFQRDVCEGFDYRAVARALLQRGYLDREPPHLTKKMRVPELGSSKVCCGQVLDSRRVNTRT